MYAMDWRNYMPDIGRFATIDPLSELYTDQTPYHFALNNPSNYSDPLGLFATRREAREYKSEHNIHGSINRANSSGEGSFAINDTTNGVSYNQGSEASQEHFQNDGVAESILFKPKWKSWMDTNYIGSSSSKLKTIDQGYRIIDMVDLAAYNHDVAYDKLLAKGVNGALIDLRTINADKTLLNASQVAEASYMLGLIDPITKKPISKKTYLRAIAVETAFQAIVGEKELRIGINSARDGAIANSIRTVISAVIVSANIISNLQKP